MHKSAPKYAASKLNNQCDQRCATELFHISAILEHFENGEWKWGITVSPLLIDNQSSPMPSSFSLTTASLSRSVLASLSTLSQLSLRFSSSLHARSCLKFLQRLLGLFCVRVCDSNSTSISDWLFELAFVCAALCVSRSARCAPSRFASSSAAPRRFVC